MTQEETMQHRSRQLHVNIEENLHRKLKKFASDRYRTISSIIRQQIRVLVADGESLKEKNQTGEKKNGKDIRPLQPMRET